MSITDKERILFRVAHLYLEEFLNRKKIASKLLMPPGMVSIIIEEIKKINKTHNYINIKINAPELLKYEVALIEKYKLKNVILVENHKNPNIVSKRIGIEASNFVSKIIKKINRRNGSVRISLGHGRIIKIVVDKLPFSPNVPMTICGLSNDPAEVLTKDDPTYHGSRISILAGQLRGKYPKKNKNDKEDIYMFPSQIPMSKDYHHELLFSVQSQRTLKKIRTSDIIIYGIGGFYEGAIYYKTANYYGKMDGISYINELTKNKCIGALGGSKPINEHGKWIKSNFNYHFIGIESEEMKKIAQEENKYSIVVGHGKERALALKVTISRKKYANVLVTNLETGKFLIDS